MADLTGARGTGNITSALRKTDMREKVLELEPDATPLTVLSGRLSKENTHNPEFKWVEDDLEPRFDAVNGTTGTGTSVVVDNPSYFAEHDLVKVTRTGELIRVQAVNSGTSTLTVVRGVGGSAVALVDNDELLILNSAQPEGDTSKPARSSNPTVVTNYTQIIRTPWESTETLIHSDTFVQPSDWERQANKHGIEHNKDWEYAFWHGKPSENTSGSQPRRTTGGFYHFVSTNITDVGGTMTEAELFAALRPAFRYGNKKAKVMFAAQLPIDVINAFPRGKLEVVQADHDTTFGLDVRELVSPHGRLKIVTSYLHEGSVYGGHAAIVDVSQLTQRPLGNSKGTRDTHIRDGIQANDADTMKSEYLTEKGLEFGLEKAHAVISNITG